MPISHRKFLIVCFCFIAPWLSSCATNLSRFNNEPIPVAAKKLGVCAASYVILDAGKPTLPVVVSGCSSTHHIDGATVFQAASLTKPVIAFVALQLVREGKLDLDAPVSRYLPDGYTHRQNPFDSKNDPEVDLVPASTWVRIPVATLLNHSSGLPNWASGTLAPENIYMAEEVKRK